MAVYLDAAAQIIPTDIFGAEPTTDAGYAREVITLTLASGDVVNCGRLIVIDDVEKTGKLATAVDLVDATKRLSIFLGRDLKTNGEGVRGYLTANFADDGAAVKVVVIDRGWGSGQVAKGYLHFKNITDKTGFFHNWSAANQKEVEKRLKLENGFKVQFQTKPLIAV